MTDPQENLCRPLVLHAIDSKYTTYLHKRMNLMGKALCKQCFGACSDVMNVQCTTGPCAKGLGLNAIWVQ